MSRKCILHWCAQMYPVFLPPPLVREIHPNLQKYNYIVIHLKCCLLKNVVSHQRLNQFAVSLEVVFYHYVFLILHMQNDFSRRYLLLCHAIKDQTSWQSVYWNPRRVFWILNDDSVWTFQWGLHCNSAINCLRVPLWSFSLASSGKWEGWSVWYQLHCTFSFMLLPQEASWCRMPWSCTLSKFIPLKH